MLKENKNYVFIVNNTFHIIYFLSLIKEYNIKNYLLVVNNTNNYFVLWKYDKLFKKNNINYIKCCWENYNYKIFLFKIIYDYIFCFIKLYKYRKYDLIISDDNNISNQIIINSIWSKSKSLFLINNNLYWLIYKKNKNINSSIKVNIFYNIILKFLWINKIRNIWENYNYSNKTYIDKIDFNPIKSNKKYLLQIFKDNIENIKKEINLNKNIILFSQNLIDEWRINKNDYLKELQKIKNKYIWYNIFIKPHPLENTSYYEKEYKVLNKFLPSELLDIYLSNFKNNIYLTFYSTIIINLNFWNKFIIDYNDFPKEEKIIQSELINTFNIKKIIYE